jgi:hypothetical protein
MGLTPEAPHSNNRIDEALDSVDAAINSTGPVGGIVAELLGVNDFKNLIRATEQVATSFPQCAVAVKESILASLSASLKALTGDMRGASQDAAKIASYSSDLSKLGAVAGAAFMVGIQFIPAGKMAKLAANSLGRSLGKALFKSAINDGLEKIAVKAGQQAFEKAIISGERDATKISEMMIERIAASTRGMFEKIAHDNTYEIFIELSRKTCSRGSLEKLLVRKVGLEVKEARNLAEELFKANIKGCFKSTRAKVELQDILIQSMQKSFDEELVTHLASGQMQGKLKTAISESCVRLRSKGHAVDNVLEQDILNNAETILADGIKKGAHEGIERGVRKAFRKFEYERHMISLRDFIRSNRDGVFQKQSIHGEKILDVAGDKGRRAYANLTNTWHEPDWKERLEQEARRSGFRP